MNRRGFLQTTIGVGLGVLSAAPDSGNELPEQIGTYTQIDCLSSGHPSVLALYESETEGHRIHVYQVGEKYEVVKNHAGDGIPNLSICQNSDFRVIQLVLRKWCHED